MIEIGVNSFPEVFHKENMAQEVHCILKSMYSVAFLKFKKLGKENNL